mmetsp:Transcript_7869/g.23682  ORF Transcript_7869/g.23682 Transcript_7869/m.23682 type:complete len:196 (+) Transcript_7869:133-720(+)
MVLYIHVGEAAGVQCGGGARRWLSTVTVNACSQSSEEFEISSTVREGSTPLWNEILEIPNFCVSTGFILQIHIVEDSQSTQRMKKQSFSIELSVPRDLGDAYCQEWINIPMSGASRHRIESAEPELRSSVRLRIACSYHLECVLMIQRGIMPIRTNPLGHFLILEPQAFLKISDDHQNMLQHGRDSPPRVSRPHR